MAAPKPQQTPRMPKKITLRTRLIRTVSFWYNKIRIRTSKTWQTNSFIKPGLFLGMLPHQGAKDIIAFVNAQYKNTEKKMPLGLVVSVVEPDELRGEGFIGVKTVTPNEWEANGVQHRSISMRDFSPEVDLKGSIEILKAMKKCIEDGKSVFIHCKAGRARSAMFCAVYMSLNENNPTTNQKYTIEEAVTFLKEKRPQVSVGLDKQKMAGEIIKAFNTQLSQQKPSNVPNGKAKQQTDSQNAPPFALSLHSKKTKNDSRPKAPQNHPPQNQKNSDKRPKMNNTAWKRARKLARLPQVRVYDLKNSSWNRGCCLENTKAEDRCGDIA